MSKIKKISISILITIISVLAICNLSNAENSADEYEKYTPGKKYSVGDKIEIDYMEDYVPHKEILCVEAGQGFGQNYNVVSKVLINGTESTDYTYREGATDNKNNSKQDKIENAIFAYLLHVNNGKNYPLFPTVSREDELGQQAIYSYEYQWMDSVGKNHYAKRLKDGSLIDTPIGMSFIGSHPKDYIPSRDVDPNGQISKWKKEAEEYAKNISNEQDKKITDNTDKDNIKVKVFEKGGKKYYVIGDFNWSFGGNLKEIKAYDQDNNEVNNILFIKFNGTTPQEITIDKISSEENFCIAIPEEAHVSSITKITGFQEKELISAEITFLEDMWGGQSLILADTERKPEQIETPFSYDIKLFGNLKVIKVVKGNETIKLSNVGFIIQNADTQKYVKKADKQISYVDKREDATEFITDNNGEIKIDNLVVGNYIAYETKNPNYGYEIISDGIPTNVVVDKTQELKIPNTPSLVKLSGYVWIDKQSSKKDLRNDLYKTDEHPEVPGYVDDKDIPKEGITVRLKNKDGETIKETTTGKDGKYQFIDVKVADLEGAYVEFEYDGFTYTNVTPYLSRNTGSKSIENEQERDEKINNKFAKVENNKIYDNNGNSHEIEYSPGEHSSTLILNKDGIDFPITATTKEAGYNLKEKYTPGETEEIKNINLGLYERSMPDMALMKDLSNVKVAVNGKAHVYEYAQRFLNPGEYDGEGFNIGVKFGNKYGSMSYTRPIYRADAEYRYESPSGEDPRELQVYVTYRISIKNQSNIKVKVNSVVDYYDKNYEIVKIGTEVSDGNVTGSEIGRTDMQEPYGNYKKTIINTNAEMENEENTDIYVQFKLNREAVLKILSSKENLNNVAEINSYTTYKDNKLYAGIDIDSNPGSATPGDKSTYEDDTDEAPGLLLEPADAREIAGKVFLDSTSGELRTGEVRQGSGAYEDGEDGIQGVKVKLNETSGSGKEYVVSTDSNGDFKISGFIPGDYTLTYTWGDETYTVQDYKATVWVDKNVKEKQDYGDKWYKNQTKDENGNVIRFSDALDEYSVSQSRNELMTMNSTTPKMNIGVEYDTTYTASTGDKYTYCIENIDFGIVERARQNLLTEKRIKTFKVISAGQTIANVTVNEDGTLSGEKKYITYMRPSQSTIPNNGFLKLELDDELMQGTTIEVTYAIKVKNESELDYLSDDYYRFGIPDPDKVVTISPTAIADYLDNGYKFDENINPQWKVMKLDDFKGLVDSKIYEDEESEIANRTILYTDCLKDKKIKPGDDTEIINVNVSKQLAISDEISLNNEVEIIKLEADDRIRLDIIPGDYIPGKAEQQREGDDAQAETIIITPSTGDNLNYIVPIAIGVTALAILGVGVILIKKKTL